MDALLAVNLKGVLLCAQAFAQAMLDTGDAVMVNISSQAGKRGWAELSVYGATRRGPGDNWRRPQCWRRGGDGLIVPLPVSKRGTNLLGTTSPFAQTRHSYSYWVQHPLARPGVAYRRF